MEISDPDITELLVAWKAGDTDALERLVPRVYRELRQVAHRVLTGERRGELHTSALVNEAYLKLNRVKHVEWQNRAHFFAFAAQLMRRIVVDLARRTGSRKRGGGLQHIPLQEDLLVSPSRTDEILVIDRALGALERLDVRKVRVVELRFYGGLSVRETAAALEISPETVHRDWRWAKAWLRREIGRSGRPGR